MFHLHLTLLLLLLRRFLLLTFVLNISINRQGTQFIYREIRRAAPVLPPSLAPSFSSSLILLLLLFLLLIAVLLLMVVGGRKPCAIP